eukprot:TRINITY_DN2891_c0_g1_i3.p1 TRINITY_DN2891_c0_g1~~TRINITY_DN2891_c0_g1_i3.p1  ORF type:complete len:280 (-),score=85.44 TRINITY_DN2891_c0_g1_i3:119-913(-)
MAPKGVFGGGRGKGKAKGKVKGKGKGKAKTTAKAQTVQPAVNAETDAAVTNGTDGVVNDGAIVVAKPKVKGMGGARKKLLDSLESHGKTVEEGLADCRDELRKADGMVEETKALEQAQVKQAEEAQEEFEAAKKAVAEAMDEEAASAAARRDLQNKKQDSHKVVEEKRLELLEVQKKLAMIEVLALNHGRMQELEEKRRAAAEAAESAKKHLMEQRAKEKAALEATRQALAEAKQQRAGAKRAAEAASAEEKQSTPKRAAVGDR